jgi:hypothetical protein
MNIVKPEHNSYFSLSVKTDDGDYKDKEEFEDFNEAYFKASNLMKRRDDIAKIYLYHYAEYDNMKPRLLTALVREKYKW